MKTIKFRAWDKEIHTWLMPSSKTARNISIFDSYGVLSLVDEDDKLVWCQFTGLYDKNGKEIYKGDIVKLKNEFYEVEFCEFGYEGHSIYGLCIIDKYEAYPLTKSWAETELEVVGNIFQNPELLKEQNHE